MSGVDVVEDRRADEGAVAGPSGSRPSTTSVAPPPRRGRSSSRMRSRAAQDTTGPTSVALVERRRRRAAPRSPRERRHQPVVRLADRDDDRARHAALAGRAEGRADDAVDGLVDHRVGHDDHVVLGAAERLHALAGLRRALVDDLRDRRRADERDRVDARVVEDPLDDLAAAVDEVDDAGRQPEPVDDLEGDLLRERHLLGRLEDERVAAARSRTAGTRTGPSPGS